MVMVGAASLLLGPPSTEAPLALAAGKLSVNQISSTFAALLCVLMAGLLMLFAVMLGARYVRRLNRRPAAPSRMVSDRWYEKPLVAPEPVEPSDESSTSND